jgi:hypothetical protein
MSYLCSDVINSALRLIGVLAAGETPNSDESTDAMQSLNALMEAWSAEQATIYEIVNFQNVLTGAQQTYTIGSGGNFNTARPLKIEKAGIITPDTLRHDMKIVGAKDWAEIEEKTLTGRLPKVLYNDNAFPLANLNVWPIPNATGGAPTIDLWLWQQMQQFATINDSFTMPPPYFRAIKYALAIELAPEYGSQAQAAAAGLANVAAAAKQEVIELNRSNAMGMEPSELPPAAAPQQAQPPQAQ